jgi:hypothetical protein
VIAVSDSPVACIVVPNSGGGDVTAGIKELLNRNRDTIAPHQDGELRFIETSVDLAFRGLQRQQCGYVAGSAGDLKAIMDALRKEPQLQYSFAPVWWNDKAIAEAAFDVKDKTVQEIKKQEQQTQEQKDREAVDAARLAKREQDKTEIERSLREKNGVMARGLMNVISDFVRGLAEKRHKDTDHTFPEFSSWLNSRFDDGWETYNVNFEIADFGSLTWENRSLPAVVVKAVIQQKNRVLGKYDDRCFFFGLIDDEEFQMQRDQFGVPCSDASLVDSWKIGKDFHSSWNAE